MALLEVARIIKPHGLKGEVVVELVTNRAERLSPATKLYAERPNGAAAEPLVIAHARPHGTRHLVFFEGVHTREQAEELRNIVLKAEAELDPEAYFVHDLIGAIVIDQDGIVRGEITGVEANPASDLLVIDGAHYVPLRFVTGRSNGRVEIDVPVGLFDV